MNAERPSGLFRVWPWTDAEIEGPAALKSRLVRFEADGAAAVLAVLGRTRYGLTDRKVVRAAAQASQWAWRRGIRFWFEPDPRKASRALIAENGEGLQVLAPARTPLGGRGGRFDLRIPFGTREAWPSLGENALTLGPSGLERAFAFKVRDGAIEADSLRDITSEARFHVDAAGSAAEVFGAVFAPDAGWHAAAFPRFDTNLMDYSGRSGLDALVGHVEALFDAGTLLSGVTWARGGACRGAGLWPVSLSLFNSFIAEYGYDLRDRLPALILPMDDGSHVPVRLDYGSLLMESVFSAFREFQQAVHAFFGPVQGGIFHAWDAPGCPPVRAGSAAPSADPGTAPGGTLTDTRRGPASEAPVPPPESGGMTGERLMDPWRGLTLSASGLSEFTDPDPDSPDADLRRAAQAVLAKSLGLFSSAKTAAARIRAGSGAGAPASFAHWADLASAFSVRLMAEPGPETVEAEFDALFRVLNEKARRVEAVTGLRLPEAEVLLVYPFETLMAEDPAAAADKTSRLLRLIGRLALRGVHADVVSATLLRAGRLSPDGFRLGIRSYRALVCPYADVVTREAADLYAALPRRGIPVLFGGGAPRLNPSGRGLAWGEAAVFDPDDAACSWLGASPLRPLVRAPEGALATVVRHSGETYVLLCPSGPGRSFEGEFAFGGAGGEVERTDGLAAFRAGGKGAAERVL